MAKTAVKFKDSRAYKNINSSYLDTNIFWSPERIPVHAWFDAADASTITASSGSVSQWNDKSGNGNHISQGTESQQPKTGTRTLNGLNVIEGLGNQRLRNASYATTGNFAMIVVAQQDNVANDFMRVMYVQGTSNAIITFRNSTNRMRLTSVIGTSAIGISGEFNPDYNPFMYCAEFDDTTLKSYGNGTLTGTRTGLSYNVNRSGELTLFHEGSGSYLDGIIAEAIIFPLSSTNRQKIEGYFSKKWGITLDPSHPYYNNAPLR